MRWQILSEKKGNIINILLKNRGIKDKKEFFDPKDPHKIELRGLGISKLAISKAIKRIKEAKKKDEHVVVYGDYDADGICATAIVWEALHEFGLNVLPHIPNRFSEGYGINPESVDELKTKNDKLGLFITVDNGIVAHKGIKRAKELGIDVVVIDHHAKGDKKLNTEYVIHSTDVCGSALAWFFDRELGAGDGLELAAIGTIADQMPLIGVNRSLVKFGLEELNETKRFGLKGEHFFMSQGVWFYALVSIILAVVVWFSLQSSPLMAFGAVIGSTAFFITHGFKENAQKSEEQLLDKNSGKSDLSKIFYLEVIDATFSIDGVIGAFAFTLSVPLILLGNGIGAFVVRELTIHNIDRIKRYVYLKNGAMYSILVLGIIMLLDSFGVHIPQWFAPVSTVVIVGYFFLKSRKALV